MAQGVLGFKYQEEKSSSGMTALAGLPTYLDLACVAGLSQSIERHVKVREKGQGWTDSQVIMPLVLLNLAGGECVEDLNLLEQDCGFIQVLRKVETYGMPRRERRALEKRQRKERSRGIPSPSAAFRYLSGFHDREAEKLRVPHRAFIPMPNQHLRGLARVSGDLVEFVQSRNPQRLATLDQDATLVSTAKSEALFGYKGFKAYQPLNTYWAEQDLVLHSEFRDGNVPAGFDNLRVLQESLEFLPAGVEEVRFRSDSAGYQENLLRYCAEGRNQRFGVIRFAVGANVSPEFKQAVAETPVDNWRPLHRKTKEGKLLDTGQEWAEVCFVPRWAGYSKRGPEYRYLAIREPLRELSLPGLEEQLTFPFPTMEFAGKGRYKVFGVVTNRLDLAGDDLIWWYRERCGKSEEAHKVMKEDLAGGKLPSGDFGENAAWWAIMILAFNLNSAMKRLVLGGNWVSKRLKAIRFGLINLPGRVIHHARELMVRLTAGHPSNEILFAARAKILALAHGCDG